MALNSVILLVVATFIVGCTLSQSEKIASQDGDNRHNQMKLLVSNNYIEMVTVYDPVWLAELWPKLRNGAHLSLNKFCWRNMTVFFQDLLDGRAWALGAVDSTGSFGSGLLWGNHFWIGSQEQCNDLDHRYQDLISNSSGRAIGHQKHISTLNRNGESTDSKDYHAGSSRESDLLARNSPPFRMAFSAVSVHLNITKASLLSSHQIVLGACLPLVCHPLDVRELLEFSVRSYEGLVGAALPRTTRVTGVRQLNQDYTVYDDPKFYIISSMILFILLLVIIGTVLEINADSYVLERDLELSRPSFKSFTKSEPAEFAIGLDKSSLYNNNVHCEYDNNNTKILQTPKILTQKSADPIHTIDGLIPNRYTEISGIFPIDDLSMDLNKHIGIRLLSTKNLNHTGIKSDVSTKCDNSYSVVTTLSDSRGKNNKYVLSTEDPSSFLKFVNRIRNFNVFNGGWIDKDNPLVRVLMCFSLKTNLGKIFSVDVGEDTLAPIHGMKVISLLWVIGVHTCLAVFELSDNKVYRGTIESNFFYQTISNATYSVDTFFVLSGLLVSYLYCQTIKKHSSVNLLSDGGFFMKALQYIGIMAHRYIRLTPPYLLVVGLAEVCSRGLRAHSPVLLGADHYNCAHFWWRNAFYVNTFYPLREMCMPWSWYLSNDTQFYFVGIFLLMVGVRHVRLAGLVAAVLLLAGWATTALVAVKTGYTPSVENPLSHYDDLYDKPWTRLGPYLIGLGAGWTLSKINCCLHISKAVSSCLWVVSVSTMLTIVYGLHGRELGMYGGAAYVTASHTAWGLAAAWVLVACVTGYGGFVNKLLSWRRFYPLSRLGYCTYLLHPLLLRTVLSSAGGVLHMSVETVVVNFVGFTVLSFMAALVVSLALEAPAVSLLRLFNPLRN